MTIAREPGSHHDALFQTLGLLGDAGAQAATGKSAGHLRLCSNPDEAREVLYVDAVKLSAVVAARGETPPLLVHLRQACERATVYAAADGAAVPVDPRAVLLGCVEKVGALSGTFRGAMADGLLSPRERRRLKGDLLQLKGKVEELWAALETDPTERRVRELQAEVAAATSDAKSLETALKREQSRRIRLKNAQAGGKGRRR